jgi:hypothetical protein
LFFSEVRVYPCHLQFILLHRHILLSNKSFFYLRHRAQRDGCLRLGMAVRSPAVIPSSAGKFSPAGKEMMKKFFSFFAFVVKEHFYHFAAFAAVAFVWVWLSDHRPSYPGVEEKDGK